MQTVLEEQKMNVRVLAATIVIGILATGESMAAKPQPPPPPPPPPPLPTSCPGDFPAIAYSTDRTVAGKKGRTQFVGSNVYLANSTGDCSILIAIITGGTGVRANYRQIGSEGRVVWIDNVTIKMLKFNISGNSVVQPLPLTPTDVYAYPQ